MIERAINKLRYSPRKRRASRFLEVGWEVF